MKNKMNKGALHLMLALCTMGSLAACSSDDVLSNISETDDAVKITVSTRNGETGTTENPWIVNDTIVLSLIDYQTATYQWNGKAWSSDSILCWPEVQTKCSFMGYYPTTATNDGLSFTIPTDQSDAAKLHAADYMTTDRLYDVEKSSDPDKQLIDLNFYHRLAKVVINITSYGSEFDAATPIFTYENILSQGNGVNVVANSTNDSQSAVEKTGELVGVKPFKETNKEGKPCYTALVSPTTVDNSTTLMIFCVNDDLRYVTYPNTLQELESGNTYTFNVKVGLHQVEITSVSATGGLTDWGTADDEEDIQ